MRTQTVLTLICFLAVSSALNATLEQSLFFVSPGNWLSYEMYSTARGIIARSSEYTNSVQHDVYSLIDLKTNKITTILTDIVTSCGNSALDFDKLHYHVPTSTLVYYCLANNSLLIIDEQEFTVQGSITTLISATFDQVKIVTDDYSVAILGMTGLHSPSPSPTHFIEINLQSYEIVNNITFDKDLRTGEAVTGYASNGKNSYVLTNTVGKDGAAITNNITVYSMYLIGNAYTLTALASVNNTFSPVFSVLYCVGDLIVTNSNQTLVVISDQGTILGSFPDIMKKISLPNSIAIVADNKSPDFYALCENYTLYKFSYKNRGFTYEVFNHAIDMQIALGSNYANPLLIVTDTSLNFTITDLTNSQTVYNTEIVFQNMILTDTTYGIINSDFNPWILSLSPRKPSSLPKVVPVQSDYYYDQKNEIISYLNATADNVCQLVQVDLKTGDTSVPMTFNATDYDICPGVLIHVENNQHGPQAVLYCGYSYLIVSQTFGQVNFTAPGMLTFTETLVADYDTLSVYRFLTNPPKESTDVFLYNYDSNTKSFKLNTTKNISDLATQDFFIEPGQVFAMAGTRFGVIDVPTLDRKIVDINSPWDTVSSFQDKSGKVYSILTSFARPGTTPAVYYDNKLDNLTGVSGYTIHAGAAGECRYWISDNAGSFVETSFYNICVTEMIEDILA